MKLPLPGRARRQVNLLPKDAFESSWVGVAFTWAMTFGKWTVIITQLVVTGVFLARFGYDRQLTDLNKEIAKKVAIIGSYSTIERDYVLAQKRVEMAGPILRQNERILSVFDKLGRITPTDMWYEKLMIEPSSASFVANSSSLLGLSQFVRQVSTDKEFDSVSINNLQDGTVGRARFQFDMMLTFGSSK